MSEEAVLSAQGLCKAFFGNAVLKDVSIEVRAGTIHALLGENGAGKSTLINLLSGNLRPDSGTITIGGHAFPALDPDLAHRHGIAVVHQELSLAPHLSVAENVALGSMKTRFGLIDYRTMQRSVQAIFTELGLEIPLATPVALLPLGTRQLIEIAKALFRAPRVLILDEPTSSLTAVEVARLKRVMRQLRDRGIALLFISHRLDEVLDLCSHVTVLKDGVRTASRALAGAQPEDLVRLMVGRDPGGLFPPHPGTQPGPVLLAVEGLRTAFLSDISLTLRAGEIVGVGGLLGQGQEELLLALCGAAPHRARSTTVAGRHVRLSSVAACGRLGIVYVPTDRKAEGLHLPQSLHFNLTLPALRRLSWHGIRRPTAERAVVSELLRRFTVRGRGAGDRAVQLSGGNQQKIAIARWMPLHPRILLLNDPTRGIDVETKREIYLLLRRLAADGAGVVLLSSDTPELVELCDRVLVLADGRVRTEIPRAMLSEEAIVGASVGAAAVAA
ncbi:MAG: sugar ABC transporter ATP-binding protein [Acetobacteraceae bacterium]